MPQSPRSQGSCSFSGHRESAPAFGEPRSLGPQVPLTISRQSQHMVVSQVSSNPCQASRVGNRLLQKATPMWPGRSLHPGARRSGLDDPITLRSYRYTRYVPLSCDWAGVPGVESGAFHGHETDGGKAAQRGWCGSGWGRRGVTATFARGGARGARRRWRVTRRERDRVRGWGAGAARLARSGSDLDDRLLGGRGPAGYCWYGRTSVVLGYALGPPVGGIQHTGRRRGDSDEPGD